MKIALVVALALLVGFAVGWRSAFSFARHLLRCSEPACVRQRIAHLGDDAMPEIEARAVSARGHAGANSGRGEGLAERKKR